VSSFLCTQSTTILSSKKQPTEFLKQVLADHMPYYQPTKSSRTDRSRPPSRRKIAISIEIVLAAENPP